MCTSVFCRIKRIKEYHKEQKQFKVTVQTRNALLIVHLINSPLYLFINNLLVYDKVTGFHPQFELSHPQCDNHVDVDLPGTHGYTLPRLAENISLPSTHAPIKHTNYNLHQRSSTIYWFRMFSFKAADLQNILKS